MSDAALTLLTLGTVVVLFVSNRVPVEVVAVGSALIGSLEWGTRVGSCRGSGVQHPGGSA